MTPFQHPACNDSLRLREGTTEEECGDLHILRLGPSAKSPSTPRAVCSFWKPDQTELDALTAGGSVMLTIGGLTHPSVTVTTTHAPEDYNTTMALREVNLKPVRTHHTFKSNMIRLSIMLSIPIFALWMLIEWLLGVAMRDPEGVSLRDSWRMVRDLFLLAWK